MKTKEQIEFIRFPFAKSKICINFAPDLVMYLVFHHVHKRESGVNPEQYPLLSSPLWKVHQSH